MKAKAKPTEADKRIGAMVRSKRILIGMTQAVLAEKLGITFQQVQKYEKGLNRISAGRLEDVANILEVPITDFYEQGSTRGAELSRDEARIVRRIRRAQETPLGDAIMKAIHALLAPFKAGAKS